MKMEPIERSETSASNTQTPGNYPKETVLQDVDSFPALGITNSIPISKVSLRRVCKQHLGQLFDTGNSESVYNDESYIPPHTTSPTEWTVYQPFSDNYSHGPANN
jgi:hypothetical protein